MLAECSLSESWTVLNRDWGESQSHNKDNKDNKLNTEQQTCAVFLAEVESSSSSPCRVCADFKKTLYLPRSSRTNITVITIRQATALLTSLSPCGLGLRITLRFSLGKWTSGNEPWKCKNTTILHTCVWTLHFWKADETQCNDLERPNRESRTQRPLELYKLTHPVSAGNLYCSRAVLNRKGFSR